MRRRFRRTARLAWLAALGMGCAELNAALPVLDTLLSGGALDEQTVAAGLREALQIGTDRATTTLSRDGGFSDDPVLRLSLPAELDGLSRTLRALGLGGQLDSLELAMNRGAERAAGEALPVFVDAIRGMTLADAFAILNGAPDAATQYFRERTSAELANRFSPVVGSALRQVGAYAIYDGLAERYDAIPFTKPPAPNLERYVTDKTLTGLFGALAEEERRIREDPAARTTALLQRVFADGAGP